jgi:hypothetical protein
MRETNLTGHTTTIHVGQRREEQQTAGAAEIGVGMTPPTRTSATGLALAS